MKYGTRYSQDTIFYNFTLAEISMYGHIYQMMAEELNFNRGESFPRTAFLYFCEQRLWNVYET